MTEEESSIPLQATHTAIKQSTCAYCGVGCGVDIELQKNNNQDCLKPTKLQGTPEHPANFGRLCVKGSHLLETIDNENRLLHPYIHGKVTDWETATDKVASEFSRIIAQYGPDSVAFYVSGQLLTEDYYAANKLMKGYIGSGNIDTNSRLCMSSAVSGYKRAFGEDVVPCDYEDLEHCDFLILIGSNAAWTHPVLFQRMERAKKLNPKMKVVVIDPRRTATTELADLFLNIKPGTDAALFNGLIRFAAKNNQLDNAFIDNHTQGFSAMLAACDDWNIEKVAAFCQITVKEVTEFYQGFCKATRALSFYSMGINQSSSGVDKCNAIINAHLATGQLLKKGTGPFSITGQPNAMGGREVGGLANQLAAHLDIDNPKHRDLVQVFWQSPVIATKQGAKAIDMFDDIASGKIKAVWIMATNPLVSLPNRNKIKKALAQCELVVVSDCVEKNETLSFADIKLPATAWIEKDGTVTNSERRISRQRGMVTPPGEAKHDWQIICKVAQKMGFSGFDFTHQSQIFDEWTRLTSYHNSGQRQLNLSGLSGLEPQQYNDLKPIQWPILKGQETQGQVFKDKQFSTESGRAQFISIKPKLPLQQANQKYPYVMNSGRIRDQWHTMTRTGKAASLNTHIDRPFISVHPFNAAELKIQEGDLINASSAMGSVIAHASLSESVRKGECFIPIHWNAEFASSANVSNLYASVVDPISGQPESKHAAVAINKVEFALFVTMFVKTPLTVATDFWVKTKLSHGFLYNMAFYKALDNPLAWFQQQSGLHGEWISYFDGKQLNLQCLNEGKIVFMAFIGTRQVNQPIEWLNHLFSESSLEIEDIQSVIYAQPSEVFQNGRLVCSCLTVREKPIIDAIKSGLNSVEELGNKLKCGTNCGSCKTELSQMLRKHTPTIAVKNIN